MPVLTDDQLRRLLAAAEGKDFPARRDTAVLRLFLDSGMRLSELANLNVSDVDLDAQVAIVMGRHRRPRPCPFGAKTTSALDRYRRLRSRQVYAETSDALWLGVPGPLGTAGIRSLIERRAGLVGIGHVHAHLFRHSFAHRWLADGATRAT